MAYEDKAKLGSKPHRIILEERSKLSVTGVEDVESFDEERIVLRTVKGDLIVTGEGLHIGKLSLDTGELCVEGLVRELSFEETQSGGFFSRLFG